MGGLIYIQFTERRVSGKTNRGAKKARWRVGEPRGDVRIEKSSSCLIQQGQNTITELT